MDQITQDIQNIIDYSHNFAEIMLNDGGEYYPFGAKINLNGELTPIGFEDPSTDNPESQPIINELRTVFQGELKAEKIRCYGITYDVRVMINDLGDKSDAICIEIIHLNDDKIPNYYFPYHWKDNKLCFGKSFGMKK